MASPDGQLGIHSKSAEGYEYHIGNPPDALNWKKKKKKLHYYHITIVVCVYIYIYIKKLHAFHVVKLWESGKNKSKPIYIYRYKHRCS